MKRCTILALGIGCFFGGWTVSSAADKPTYNRDIRPILVGELLRLSRPGQRVAEGRFADRSARRRPRREAHRSRTSSAESELLRRIFSTDPDEMMPPPDSHKKLTAGAERDDCKQWMRSRCGV